jgi:DNA polymerase III sliding clamp (beta) subunit (PCNA family)
MSAQITERPPAPASPLPDVIRLTVPAKHDGEDWFTFNADKTAAEVPEALRRRFPHLAAVTLDESGGWLRVIERPSWDAPVERYRIRGLDWPFDLADRTEYTELLPVYLVRLGCDDPGPEEAPIVPQDEREPDDNAFIALVQHRAAFQPTERQEDALVSAADADAAHRLIVATAAYADFAASAVAVLKATNNGEETQPVIATETPADTEPADEATKEGYRRDYAAEEAERALAAASVPPKRSRKAPVAAPPAPGALAVTVAREPLRAALRTVVTAAASGRVIVPITANVLIEAYLGPDSGWLGERSAIRITCTDLSQRLSVEVAAIVGVDGAYTVPAKLLSQLVDTFTALDVTLRQDGEVLRVTSGKSRGHLKGIDAAEFPEDRQDGGDTCTLSAAVLRRALTLAEWAAARDESRPVLRCVCLTAAGGTLVAQAADGTALSYWSVPLAGVPDFTALLPRDAVEAMARLLTAREGDVTLSLLPNAATPNVLRLALGGEVSATLSTRTSEGQMPGLLRVVPKTHTLAITVQRSALLGAVRQAGVVADRTPGKQGFRPSVLVNLRAEPGADGADDTDGALHVWSTNASVGEQRTEIAASITSGGGEPLLFKLDGPYLVEMLGALDEALDGEPGDTDDGAVTLRLSTALNPVRLGCAALPEWIGVLMPMTGGTE